jgi:hypothetical protein
MEGEKKRIEGKKRCQPFINLTHGSIVDCIFLSSYKMVLLSA